MSQTPLWKPGRFPGMEFCGSWNRLEQEEPQTFKLIQAVAGAEGKDQQYSYKVYSSKYGLSIGRKKLEAVATKLTDTKITDTMPAEPVSKEDRIEYMHKENINAQNKQTEAIIKLADAIFLLAKVRLQ